MTLTGLVIKEMARRRLGLALSVAAAVAATAVYVSYRTISRSTQDALRTAVFKMGHNLLIVPSGAPREWWSPGFGDQTIPEDLTDRLAGASGLPAGHLWAMYQRRIRLQERDAILTGVRTVPIPGEVRGDDAPAFDVSGASEADVGASIAAVLTDADGRPLRPGSTIAIEGRPFTVRRILPDTGDLRDIRIFINLRTMQEMMDDTGRINAIAAVGRMEPGVAASGKEVSQHLKRAAGGGVDVVLRRRAFETGDTSQRMVHTLGVVLSVTLLFLSGLGVALYMYNNVSERRHEMAVLVALGYRPARIAAALLSKVVVVGAAGGLLGLLVGTAVAVAVGPSLVAVSAVAPVWGLWWQALAFAVVLCAAAAVVAVLETLRLQVAELLRNQ